MHNVFKALEDQGIAPVVSINNYEKAKPLAKAFLDGGITSIEIVLRTDDALKAISLVKETYPHMTVSAGTCITQKNVDDAKAAGADYVVSPGYNQEIVDYCQKIGVEIIPGCITASELDRGISSGIRYFKFFPAEQHGGFNTIKALCGPYKNIRFMPTGGLDFNNIGAYLSNPEILACGGSYMAKSHLIENEEWRIITDNCRKAMDISLGFSLAHVGINNEDEKAALNVCRTIADIFRLPVKNGHSSAFCGTDVECMKKMFYGRNGHIGFKTRSVERSKAYFESKGLTIIEESYKTDKNGLGAFFYLQNEVGGFALHVLKV